MPVMSFVLMKCCTRLGATSSPGWMRTMWRCLNGSADRLSFSVAIPKWMLSEEPNENIDAKGYVLCVHRDPEGTTKSMQS